MNINKKRTAIATALGAAAIGAALLTSTGGTTAAAPAEQTIAPQITLAAGTPPVAAEQRSFFVGGPTTVTRSLASEAAASGLSTTGLTAYGCPSTTAPGGYVEPSGPTDPCLTPVTTATFRQAGIPAADWTPWTVGALARFYWLDTSGVVGGIQDFQIFNLARPANTAPTITASDITVHVKPSAAVLNSYRTGVDPVFFKEIRSQTNAGVTAAPGVWGRPADELNLFPRVEVVRQPSIGRIAFDPNGSQSFYEAGSTTGSTSFEIRACTGWLDATTCGPTTTVNATVVP